MFYDIDATFLLTINAVYFLNTYAYLYATIISYKYYEEGISFILVQSIHRLHVGTFHHIQLNAVLIVGVLIFAFIPSGHLWH